MIQEGWKCPECGAVNAPWRATCDHIVRISIDPITVRIEPSIPLPPATTRIDCGCPVSMNCNSTACPRRMNPYLSLKTNEASHFLVVFDSNSLSPSNI